MHKLSLGVLALLAVPALLAAVLPANAAPTPPPEIYRVLTRPLCAELHEHIAPAIGMMLENDTTIGKSPALFEKYNRAALSGGGSTGDSGAQGSSGDSAGATMNDAQNIALLGMESLIRPIANNIIAVQKMLDSPALTTGTGVADDDKRLQEIRAKLLQALAVQSASLDIISGFVDTQQMADLQHAGQEYIAAMNQGNVNETSEGSPAPNPLTYDPNSAGLPANPYDMSLAAVPGLTLGYNPVTRLIDGLHWTIGQTATRENDAAKAVMTSATLCSNAPSPSPAP